MFRTIIYSITGLVLLAASVTDIKKREVPDWLNYSAATAGIAISLLYSIITGSIWPIAYSLAGFTLFFLLANIMFYAGQWGGGDSKMLIAIGSLLGLEFSLSYPYISLNQPLSAFWMNLLIAGVVYAFAWSIALAIKNRQRFAKQISQQSAQANSIAIIGICLFAFSIFIIQDSQIRNAMAGIGIISAATAGLWAFGKTIEKTCMLKYVKPQKLTEGDWIAKDVYINNRYICGPKDLGIEKRQIQKLLKLSKQGKIKRILIKEGIPFVPAFFISFVLTMKFGNLLTTLFNALL